MAGKRSLTILSDGVALILGDVSQKALTISALHAQSAMQSVGNPDSTKPDVAL